jgi:RND family efflux transporter MFP subunit
MEARQLFVEEWTEIIGTTQPLPDRAARVTAAVEGHVVSVLKGADGKPVAEGQRVKKGDVLIRLDDSIAQANLQKALADQEDLKQQIQQAGFAVQLAEIELQKFQELSKDSLPGKPLVSPVELKKAEVGVADARGKRIAAELHAKAGEKQVKALQEQLKFYTLTAPISGRLSRVFVVPGQTLAVGTLAAEVIDLDEQIDLLCFVPPYLLKKLKLGQQVRIGGLENRPGSPSAEASKAKSKGVESAQGKIVFIADQSEMDTGNFAVKARFPNAGIGLRGFVTLRARVLTVPGKAALTLPESALLEDQDPPGVIVVEDHKQEKNKEGKETETGKARKLQVTVGIRDRVLHLVEIKGLDDLEKKWHGTLDTAKFVTEKGQGLKNGDAIRLEEEEEEEAPAPAEGKKEG